MVFKNFAINVTYWGNLVNFNRFFVVMAILSFLPLASAFVADINANPITVTQGDSVTVYAVVTKSPSDAWGSVDLNVSDAAGNFNSVHAAECTPVYQDKTYLVKERISKDLTLVSSSPATPSQTGDGDYTEYVFDNVAVDGNSSAEVIMNFKNSTKEPLETASINTTFSEGGQECTEGSCEFEIFIFNTVVPAIPEFASIFLPILAVLFVAFLVRK